MKITFKFIKLCIAIPNENEPIRPYIVSFKKGLFGKWHYVMDSTTRCPKLYFGDRNDVESEGLDDIHELLFPKKQRKENDQ